jgi:MFS family permease
VDSSTVDSWFAAAFAVTFVGFGCTYSFSAFIEFLQRDFGASRGSVSLVFALAGFLHFSVGSISGPLADHFGSRRLALIGMILIGTGLAIASVAQNLLEVYAALRTRHRPRRRMLLRSGG